jgi:hypothetical protein
MNLPPRRRRLFYSCDAAERGHVNLFLPAAADGPPVEPENKTNRRLINGKISDFIVSFHCIWELFDLPKET